MQILPPSQITDNPDTNTYDSQGNAIQLPEASSFQGNILPTVQPTASQSKRANLAKNSIDKRAKIGDSGWAGAKLDILTDIDSPTFRGEKAEDRSIGFDGYEVYHDDPQSKAYFASSQGQAKMYRQRHRLAQEQNIPYEQVTNEMVYARGAQQTVQGLYDLTSEKGDGPFDNGTLKDWEHYGKNKLVLGDKDSPMGIDVLRKGSGQVGEFGRELSQTANPNTGVNISDKYNNPVDDTNFGALYPKSDGMYKAANHMSGVIPYRQSDEYKASQQKIYESKFDEDGNLIDGDNGPGFGSNLLRSGAAGSFNLFSKGAELLGEGIESVGDITGSDFLRDEGKQIQEEQISMRDNGEWNKLFGYDDSGVQKIGKNFADAAEKNDLLGMAKALMDPEALTAFVNSGAEMAAMMNPYGLGAIALGNVNQALNDIGPDATNEQRMTSIALSTFGTLLDRIGDKAVMGHGGKAIKGMFNKLPASAKKAVLAKYKKPLVKLGVGIASVPGKAGFEGATEGAQTILEGKASDVSKQNMNLTAKEKREALEATGIGAAAGGVPSVATSAKDIVGGAYDATNSVLQKVADPKRSRKYREGMDETKKASIDALDKTSANGSVGEYKAPGDRDPDKYTKEQYDAYSDGLKDSYNLDPAEVRTKYDKMKTDKDPMANSYGKGMKKYRQEQKLRTKQKEMYAQEEAEADKAEAPKEDAAPEPTPEPIYEPTTEQQKEMDKTAIPDKDTDKIAEFRKRFENEINQTTGKKYSPEQIDRSVARFKESLERAGISNDEAAELLSTREEGINLAPSDKETDRITLKNDSKGKSFNIDTLNDETLDAIGKRGFLDSDLDGKLESNELTKLKERTAKGVGYGSDMYNQVQDMYKKATKSESNALDGIIKDGDKNSNAKKFKTIALVLSEIKGSIEAEFHKNKNEMLNTTDKGVARKEEISQELGKKYLNSYGLKLSGDSAKINKRYMEIGNAMLQFAEDNGFIESGKTELSINKLYNKETGINENKKSLASQDGMEGLKETFNKAGSTTLTKPYDTYSLPDNENDGSRSKPNSPSANTATFIKNLITPANFEPTQKNVPVESVTIDGEIKVDQTHQEHLDHMQELKNMIKPEMFQLLQEIKKMIWKDGSGDFDKELQSNKGLQKLLGIESSGNEIFNESESGRNMSRKDNLRNILEQLDFIGKDEFHFTYKKAINDRIHVMQTVLEFQSDKYIARNLITGGKYNLDDSTDFGKMSIDILTESIAEGFENWFKDIKNGLTANEQAQEQLLNPTDKKFVTLRNVLEDTDGNLKLEDLNFLADEFNVGNPFEMMNMAGGANAIRLSKRNKDGSIKSIESDFMTEFDATASGVVNTLLNLSGNPEVQELIKKFAVDMGQGFNEDAIDPYKILVQKIEKTQAYKNDTQFRKEMDDLQAMNLDMRLLSKSPVMTWFYGQQIDNVADEMAFQTSLMVANEAVKEDNELALAKVNEIIGDNKYSTDQSLTIDPKDIDEAAKLDTLIKEDKEYYVYDTETTGLGDDADIIQISATPMKGSKQNGESISFYIPTDKTIEPGAEKTHGVSNKKLAENTKGMDRNEQLQKVADLLGDKPVVAHNAEFDVSKTDANMKAAGIDFKIGESIDTLGVAKSNGSNDFNNLGSLYAKYNDGAKFDAHDAKADTEALASIIPNLDKDSTKQQSNSKKTHISQLSEKDFAKMVEYYRKNVAGIYTENLDSAFPGVKRYREGMKELFKLVDSTGAWKGTIKSAIGTIISETGDGTGQKMSIQKEKQFIDGVLGDLNVLSNDKFNNLTSFMVNLQHSVDAALMIVSTNRALAKADTDYAVMTVHDASYTRPDLNILIKEEYEKLTVEIAQKYDFMQAAMDEVQDQIDKLPKDSSQKVALQEKLDNFQTKYQTESNQAAKAEFLSNLKTDIYGSSISRDYQSPKSQPLDKKPKPKKKPKSPEQKAVESFQEKTAEVLSNMKASKKSGKYSKASVKQFATFLSEMDLKGPQAALRDKIVDYLENGNITLFGGDHFEGGFREIQIAKNMKIDPRLKGVSKPMTEQSLVEILGHELDHALTFAYTVENESSGEVTYIRRALADLAKKFPIDYLQNQASKDGMPAEVASRLMYMLYTTKDEDYQVSEFVSIMQNEPDVMAYVYDKSSSKIWDALSRLMTRIKEWINKLTSEERAKVADKVATAAVNYRNTAAALSLVNKNAEVYGAHLKVKENIDRRTLTDEQKAQESDDDKTLRLQKEIFDDAYADPLKYLNKGIETSNSMVSNLMVIFGDEIYNRIYPSIKSGSQTVGEKFPVYQSAINLIHHGFTKTEFARKMQVSLNLTSDFNEKKMNDLQQLGTEISQETNRILTNELPKLMKKVKKEFPKKSDQDKIFKIFTKTGFAGLTTNQDYFDGFINGKMTVDEMIKDFETRHPKGDVAQEQLQEARNIANYYLNADKIPGSVNADHIAVFAKDIQAYTTLVALSKIEGAQDMITSMDKSLMKEIAGLAEVVRATSETVNLKKERTDGKVAEDNTEWNYDFDGTYTKDIFNKNFEYKILSPKELKYGKYSKDDDWMILREPNEDGYGVVARETFEPNSVKGVGLNQNKFFNGFFLDVDQSEAMNKKLKSYTLKDADTYLRKNNIVKSDGKYRVIIDEKTKIEKLGLIQDVAETLWRTYAHNTELIESGKVREMVVDQFVETLDTDDDLVAFNKKVADNDKLPMDRRVELSPFLKINTEWTNLDDLPSAIRDRYMVPKNMSNHNGFRSNVTLVRKDMSDILMGHKSFAIFGDSHRTMAKYERYFKELIVLTKMHMVVTAPLKLTMDLASNATILSMNNVSWTEMYRGFKGGFKKYDELATLRGNLVQAKLDSAINFNTDEKTKKKYQDKIVDAEKAVENSDFYDAFKHGFVQSYSTDLMVKEFDSVQGLQSDINKLVDYITTDKAGNPNEIKKAIKWWMRFGASKGFTIDSLLKGASKLSKVNGTKIGDELLAMSKRLKSKKDMDSVSEYVSDIIGAPSSEMVGIGGASMVITDALSKYTLAQRLIGKPNPSNNGKPYTKEQAYLQANKVFIDYRQNLPSEIRAMSDYGIMMFPAFWMKIQAIIGGLIKYRPLSSVGGYMLEDALGANGANILDSNVIFKMGRGTVVNDPLDSFSATTIFPFL